MIIEVSFAEKNICLQLWNPRMSLLYVNIYVRRTKEFFDNKKFWHSMYVFTISTYIFIYVGFIIDHLNISSSCDFMYVYVKSVINTYLVNLTKI